MNCPGNFGEWGEAFPNNLLGASTLDRIRHGAYQLVLDGGSGFNGFSLAHNVASKAEAEQVIGQAAAAGATPIKSAQKLFWDGYSGYLPTRTDNCGRRRIAPFSGSGRRIEAV